jgi:hypothetical protein
MSKKRERIGQVLATLAEIVQTLSAEQQPLREELARLRAAVGALPRSTLLIKTPQLEAIERRTADLRETIVALQPLRRDRDLVAGRTRQLLSSAEVLADADFRAFFLARLSALQEALAGIVDGVADRSEIDEDYRRLDELRQSLPSLEDGLAAAHEIEDLLRRMHSDLRLAELRATLPRLRKQLTESGVTDAWLTQVRELLVPLREHIGRDRPPVIEELGALIQELGDWRGVLAVDCPAYVELSRVFQRRAKEWKYHEDQAFIDLRDQVVAEERRLHALALDERRAAVAELERRHALFRSLGESDPSFEALYSELRAASPAKAREHADWKRRSQEALQRFRAVIGSHSHALERLHNERLAEAEQELAVMGGDALPMSDENRRRLQALRERVEAPRKATDPEATLAAIDALGDLLAELRELRRQSEDEARALRERKAKQEAKAATLLELAERLRMDMAVARADLLPPQPPDGVPQGLMAAERDLDAQGRRLRAFEQQCVELTRERAADMLRRAETLRTLTRPPAGAEPMDSGVTPDAAIDATLRDLVDAGSAKSAMQQAETALCDAEQALRSWCEAQRVEADALSGRLTRMDDGRLSALQSDELERAKTELAAFLEQGPDALPARVRELREAIENARDVLRSLQGDAHTLDRDRAALLERHRRLRQAVGRAPLDEWIERVGHLLEGAGLPGVPSHLKRAQQGEAAAILDRLEAQAPRLAAAYHADQLRRLEAVAHSHPKARSLLARIERLPAHEALPSELSDACDTLLSALGRGVNRHV